MFGLEARDLKKQWLYVVGPKEEMENVKKLSKRCGGVLLEQSVPKDLMEQMGKYEYHGAIIFNPRPEDAEVIYQVHKAAMPVVLVDNRPGSEDSLRTIAELNALDNIPMVVADARRGTQGKGLELAAKKMGQILNPPTTGIRAVIAKFR